MSREKRQTKVAQMNKTEWDICRTGQRFNVDIITNIRKEPTTKDLLKQLVLDMTVVKSDIASLKISLTHLDTRVTELENRLTKLENKINLTESTKPV
ncbi:MAG: hypothetical protein LBV37_02535 [Mycoplasmataceae bacterium]|jgi:predicted  nucleic acid-binding Zn-ribbon protein|nr:hypothetical protein [Mycoplasmataceae bacterium]